jgi:hypothetical protein
MTMFEFDRAEIIPKSIVKDGDLIAAFAFKIYTKQDNAKTVAYVMSDVDLAEMDAGLTTAEEILLEVVEREKDALLAYLESTVQGYVADPDGNLSGTFTPPPPPPDPREELGGKTIDAKDLQDGKIYAKHTKEWTLE